MAEVNQGGADPQLGSAVTLDGGLDQIQEAVGIGLADRMPSRRIPAHGQGEKSPVGGNLGQLHRDVHALFGS